MTTRLYTPADYPLIAKWWEAHRQPAVPETVLPKCGVVVCTEEGTPVAAVWIYQDNSVGVAWLAWLVTNASAPAFIAEHALTVLLGGAEAVAREAGYKLIFTWTDTRSLKAWFPKHGFTKSCEDAVCFIKPL